MENIHTTEEEQEEEDALWDAYESSRPVSFVGLLSHLVSIPLFILLHKTLPNPDWVFHLDRILLVLLTMLAVELLFMQLRVLVIIGFFAALILLSYNSYYGGYGFRSLYEDYHELIIKITNAKELT